MEYALKRCINGVSLLLDSSPQICFLLNHLDRNTRGLWFMTLFIERLQHICSPYLGDDHRGKQIWYICVDTEPCSRVSGCKREVMSEYRFAVIELVRFLLSPTGVREQYFEDATLCAHTSDFVGFPEKAGQLFEDSIGVGNFSFEKLQCTNLLVQVHTGGQQFHLYSTLNPKPENLTPELESSL